jgi:mRNA-degrading endonuclease HigB of HigAB toxin-antitoxin module
VSGRLGAARGVKGNSYRLVALIGFNRGIVSVQRIGTHAEYNTWTL